MNKIKDEGTFEISGRGLIALEPDTERNYIESKLDEADRLAETVKERLSHEEVFGTLHEKIRK